MNKWVSDGEGSRYGAVSELLRSKPLFYRAVTPLHLFRGFSYPSELLYLFIRSLKCSVTGVTGVTAL